MKKTALIAADGFEEVEGLTIVDLLRRAGIVCDIVSLGGGEEITGSHGIRIIADRPFDGTDFAGYDAVILPGGQPGTDTLLKDGRVIELLRRFAGEGKVTAAVCAAPTVLAAAGLLEGKKAVCYPGLEERLTGALVRYEPAVQDGNIITGRGVGAAIFFALQIIRALEGEEAAKKIGEKIVFRVES
jgi:4-methyl-5(b-hydroxyethyl)-thiazole monophosphate biosynthesis